MIRHRQFLTRVECYAFCIFTLTRASRHNGVHFLNSSTTKSAPNPLRLTRIAPPPRAILGPFNFQRGSNMLRRCGVFQFCFGNAFRATAACNVWSLIRLSSGVGGLLRDFSTFSRALILFLLTLALLSAFLTLLSTVAVSVHKSEGNLTSKIPSVSNQLVGNDRSASSCKRPPYSMLVHGSINNPTKFQTTSAKISTPQCYMLVKIDLNVLTLADKPKRYFWSYVLISWSWMTRVSRMWGPTVTCSSEIQSLAAVRLFKTNHLRQ